MSKHKCDELDYANGLNSNNNIIDIYYFKPTSCWNMSVEYPYDNRDYFLTHLEGMRFCPFCGNKLD